MRTLLATTMLLLLAVSLANLGAHAEPSAAYSISLGTSSVSVSVHFQIYQNLTDLEPSFRLPEQRGALYGGNASQVTQLIQESLQTKSPQALVTSLDLGIASSAWSNTTKRQWFNVTLSFQVDRVSTAKGGVATVDMSWKSFAVPSDMEIAGVEVNKIGTDLLLQVANQIASENSTPSPIGQTSFIVNSRQQPVTKFAEVVSRINLFNFSSFSTPVSQWQAPFIPLTDARTWSNAAPGLGMSFTKTFAEPEGTFTQAWGLFYSLQAEITAPGGSTSIEDKILVSLDSNGETVMGITIIGLSVLGSGTFLFERRLTRGRMRKKSKR